MERKGIEMGKWGGGGEKRRERGRERRGMSGGKEGEREGGEWERKGKSEERKGENEGVLPLTKIFHCIDALCLCFRGSLLSAWLQSLGTSFTAASQPTHSCWPEWIIS